MAYNEADTRAKIIDPKIKQSGWTEDFIAREFYFTDGKIFLVGDEAKRKEPKKADYILYYNDALPLAVVEAKEEGKPAVSGMQQAKEYAERLDILFAYSTNGHQIEEFDFVLNTQKTIEAFPTQDELYQRYLTAKSLNSESVAPLATTYNKQTFNANPRYYQQVAIRRALEAITKGQKRILLNLATGTGKTTIAFQIAWKLKQAKQIRRVLFLADRNVLRDQAFNTFEPFGNARGYIEEGQAPTARDIYFSIYQAMWSEKDGKRIFEQYPKNFFDLIIIDECHRSGFSTWNEILKHFSTATQLGMTATPKQDENINTYKYFGDPQKEYQAVYEYSMAQGIDDGFLANFLLHKVKLNIDKDGVKIEDAVKSGAKIEVPDEAEPNDFYKMEQFEKNIILPDRTEKMCEHLAGLIKTYGEMQKTIVFCVTMEHAGEVAKHLQNHFAHLGFPNYAVRIVSEETDSMSLLKTFQDQAQNVPVVATTVDLLSTGFDAPTVQNIVFMKPIRSPIVFKQIMGRGSRISKEKGKFWYRVIDYTNATRLIDEWIEGKPEIKPETPRTNYLNGIVVEEETLAPVENALMTIQLSANEQTQARTNTSGEFSFTNVPEGKIKLYVSASGYKHREITVETQTSKDDQIQIELTLQKKPVPPIKVHGLTVFVEDEMMFEVDVLGKRLSLKEYVAYSKEEIAKAVKSANDLKTEWTKQDTRDALVAELENQGINIRMLAKITNNTEADEYDLLANLGFGENLHSRQERAEAVLTREQEFLNALNDEQKKIINGLLLKYKENGVMEITKANIFDVYPMPGFMYSQKAFGNPQALRQNVDRLQEKIYAN
ncbi:MAG: DEAD/DEAH box helicase family protein [Candidatus Pacebacteria bacterium]|nr:DEAD/DEAH box helicase family protein [Candidatus Paceibacterota bacterium]MDD5445972.1 DEAD/DEAH box helicase family protein [Candidatus Paceibacterota bacterium]